MIEISDNDLHAHLKARMEQHGITKEEIEYVLNEEWNAKDAKTGTLARYSYPSIFGNGKVKYLKRKRLACIINSYMRILCCLP